MKKEEMEHFKNKLLLERERVNGLLKKLKENEVINSNSEMSTEISFTDNHPSDTATELFDKEKGLALKGNEVSIIKKIDVSLENIGENTYGICKGCGIDIPKERLEFIPYAQYCVNCQTEINKTKSKEANSRPIEEKLLKRYFNNEYYEEDDDYDNNIEKISNTEYKNQLPD